MSTVLWSENPLILFGVIKENDTWTFKPEILTELGYSSVVDSNRNANALARFIVFWLAGIWLLRVDRSPPYAYMFIAAALLFLTSSAYHRDAQPTGTSADAMRFCQAPSGNNPMANVSFNDYNNGPRLPACPTDAVSGAIEEKMNTLPITGGVIDKVGKRDSRITDRQFYSMPVTTVPASRDNFSYALFGDNISRRVDHGFVNAF